MPKPPSPLNPKAWKTPATRDDYAAAATHLLTATEMGLTDEQQATDEEKQAFIRMLASYDYTRAELLEAMREVPRDPERFGGKSVTIQDVHRVIRESRQMRARLEQKLTMKAVNEVCTRYPEELSPEDFKCCGFNEHDNPLYRYAPDVESHAGPPRAQLDVDDRPGADRTEGTTGEPKQLGEALEGDDQKKAS